MYKDLLVALNEYLRNPSLARQEKISETAIFLQDQPPTPKVRAFQAAVAHICIDDAMGKMMQARVLFDELLPTDIGDREILSLRRSFTVTFVGL